MSGILQIILHAAAVVRMAQGGQYNETVSLEKIITAERNDLARLANGGWIYTEDHTVEGIDTQAIEYCKMKEEHYRMFTMLLRGHTTSEKTSDNKRIVRLKRLYEDSGSPRKWMEYVIFYSSQKRFLKMNRKLFAGIAVYSQFYCVEEKHLHMLICNLFNLYIKPVILEDPESFHDVVYKDSNLALKSELERSMLERLMVRVLKMVVKLLGIPYKIEGNYLRMFIRDNCEFDEWCEKAVVCLAGDKENNVDSDFFKNIIMDRLPLDFRADYNAKRILLTLIGMIRSGKHIVTVKSKDWVRSFNFQDVIKLVNTNKNLVGVTEIDGWEDINEIFGNIKDQLEFLEAKFGRCYSPCIQILNLIESLNNIDMKVILDGFIYPVVIVELLNSPKIRSIWNLKILDASGYQGGWAGEMLSFIAGSKKVVTLELYNAGGSLGEFFLNENFGMLKDKLKAIGVRRVGNLDMALATDLLSGLKVQRIHIDEADADIVQLRESGIITRAGFKYLVFTQYDNYESASRIADLRASLGIRTWPIFVAKSQPSSFLNVDYTRVCVSRYALSYPKKIRAR